MCASISPTISLARALDAVDGWARSALDYGGPDADAPGFIAAAVDALLGVDVH